MSDDKRPRGNAIINVGFVAPVALAGQSMESWQLDRGNCKGTTLTIEGNWCVITHVKGRTRIPLTNVAYVLEVQA